MSSFIAEIYESDLVWLAYAAGIAQGSGNTTGAASLFGILNRLEPTSDGPVPTIGEDGVLDLEDNLPDNVRTIDPAFFPEAGYEPQNRPDDFGAGPGPGI